jgi:hypothetical protein
MWPKLASAGPQITVRNKKQASGIWARPIYYALAIFCGLSGSFFLIFVVVRFLSSPALDTDEEHSNSIVHFCRILLDQAYSTSRIVMMGTKWYTT